MGEGDGGGGEEEDGGDCGGDFEGGGTVVGGAIWTLAGGGGGVNGTFSGGIVEEDVGVAGVGALPGVGLTGPGGGGTFIGAAELCDPGRNAGLEVEVSFELEDPFLTSANRRCDRNTCQCKTSIA